MNPNAYMMILIAAGLALNCVFSVMLGNGNNAIALAILAYSAAELYMHYDLKGGSESSDTGKSTDDDYD